MTPAQERLLRQRQNALNRSQRAVYWAATLTVNLAGCGALLLVMMWLNTPQNPTHLPRLLACAAILFTLINAAPLQVHCAGKWRQPRLLRCGWGNLLLQALLVLTYTLSGGTLNIPLYAWLIAAIASLAMLIGGWWEYRQRARG
ncbi:hypothetical protein [uncultured Cardiobacterium sp.]|uniref:hypothetical protein n=1 Tax=uncultured Cardiobacterium sp. TaxID=417619 RepID=UPI002601FC85|nr:hypothetical protein [uncultured Cardiobacterium sp.]